RYHRGISSWLLHLQAATLSCEGVPHGRGTQSHKYKVNERVWCRGQSQVKDRLFAFSVVGMAIERDRYENVVFHSRPYFYRGVD
ncbi:hypothetical protein U1Q18_038083, partial [Sarracenia purpurea var. burkii]